MTAPTMSDAQARQNISDWALRYIFHASVWLPAAVTVIAERTLVADPAPSALFGLDAHRASYLTALLVALPFQLWTLSRGGRRYRVAASLEIIADRNVANGSWKGLSLTKFVAGLVLGVSSYVFSVFFLRMPAPSDPPVVEAALAIFHLWLVPGFLMLFCVYALRYVSLTRERRKT